ncbi:MAG: alpha/beta hydrolase [Eubacteriales bacterium]|nr:alpha/beta hydrolase [Eubacteriales bacterium]
MENRKEFYFPSSDGVTQIHAVEWGNVEKPVGVLQIAHGVAEYALRYEPFAQFMNAHGFIVVANDHLGHGLSVAEGAAPLYFGRHDGWRHVVDDMYALRDMTGKKYPELPYFLLGHSMGSFLTRTYLIRYPGTLSGAIIMGTGQQSPAVVALGSLFAKVEGNRIGYDQFSPTVDKLAFGAYNKPFAPNRTAYDWLSVNEENVDRYIADPLCGGNATIGLFLDMLRGIGLIGKQSNVNTMNANTPVFFISGDRDPVGDMGKGVRAAYESFRKAGVKDVSLKLYEGLRHEILNETCRETVFADLWSWIEKHL